MACALVSSLALLAALGLPAQAEQVDYNHFDHAKTGFPLDGQHLNVKCEQCHLNGTFEGTPRACQLCHVQGNLRSAVYMPAKHIPIESKAFKAADCDTCHTTNAFQGQHFVHTNVSPSNVAGVTCLSCHNNYFQTGIPRSGHPQINATGGSALSLPETGAGASNGTSCDQCHTVGSFAGAFMTFPIGHIPTALACATCHSAGYGVGLTQMVHTGITGSCTTCHAADAPAVAPLLFTMNYGTANGAAVTLKPTSENYHPPTSSPPTHITVSFSCNQCHTTPATPMLATSAAGGFAGGVMNHSGITNGCATCHADGSGPFIGLTGAALVTESSKGPHIPINGTPCENCHKSTTVPGGFAGTAMVHTGLNGLNTCAACHENNATDLGYYGLTSKLVVRPPIAAPAPNAVTPVDANHPTTGDCSGCHTSTTSFTSTIAKPSNHIPLTATNDCATNCHTAGFAPPMTKMVHSDPAVASESCNSCHASGAGPYYGSGQGAGGQPQQPPGTVGTSGSANHIPVASADCKGCHATVDGLVSAMSATGFKLSGTPVLSTSGHAAVNSLSCKSCHSSGMAWYGVTTLAVPPGTVGTAGAANHIPVGSVDCSGCHATNIVTSGFHIATTPALSTAGHAAVNSVTCATCHYLASTPGNVVWYGTTAVGPPGTVGTVGGGNHIAFGTGDCVTCHGSTIAAGAFKISATPPLGATGHAAVSALSCASCHGAGSAWYGVPSLVVALSTHIPVGNAACSACHGSNFISGGFVMPNRGAVPPTTSPVMTVATHAIALAALGNSCSQCHDGVANPGALTFQGVGGNISLRPGSAAPGLSSNPTDPNHATGSVNGLSMATGDCVNCHTTTPPFSPGANALPGNHIPLTTTSTCATNCHKSGYSTSTTQIVHTDSAVSSESCTSCHGAGTGPFYGTQAAGGGQPQLPPGTVGTAGTANHIPVGSADCKACHTAAPPNGTVGTMTFTAFKLSVTPLLNASGHAAVNSVSCATCHGTSVDTAGGWYGLTARTTLQVAEATGTPHIPTGSAACSGCHGSSFVTGGFVMPSKGVVPPTSSPVLSVAGHAVATAALGNSCNQCHDGQVTATATTFQGVGGNIMLRPGSPVPGMSPNDTAHATGNLASPNDCVTCHTTAPPFTGSTKPSNHIPLTSSTTCATSCHSGGYTATTTAMTHTDAAVSGETCNTCHAASVNTTFYGTGVGSGGQPVGTPGSLGTPGANNHIPVGSADCKACHTATPPNGLVSSMTGTATGSTAFQIPANPNVMPPAAHTAVVSAVTCATCHYLAATPGNVAWKGVSVKAPPGTPGTPGAANHIGIPSGDACTVCHANTGYTTFTGTAMNHAGISSGCASCHATGDAWYGVTTLVTQLSTHIVINAGTDCSKCHSLTFTTGGFKITSAPVMTAATHTYVSATCTNCHENNAADLTFQGVLTSIYLRPGATAAGLSPVDANHAVGQLAAPNNCSGCHTTTPPFTGSTKPSNHIPSSATCANCHTGFTPATTTMSHSDSGVGTAGSPTACATCHGWGVGPFYGTAQGQAGGQPLQPPGTSGGAASSSQHLPFGTATCNTCHTSTTVPGGFAGATVPHTSGPFMTYTRGSGSSGTGSSTPKCVTCHAPSGTAWYNAKLSTETMGSHHGSSTTADCIDCHSATGGFAAVAAAAKKAAQVKALRTTGVPMRPGASPATPSSTTSPNQATAPSSGAIALKGLAGTGPYSHLGVAPGSCASCHSPVGGASAMPGSHLRTTLACDACHRTTAWAPATYAHAGIGPGRCASCHAGPGTWATSKPARHLLTMRSCDVCHHSTSSWEPVIYDHLSPRYRPQAGMVRCVSCHTNNTEMVAAGLARGHKGLGGAPIRRP